MEVRVSAYYDQSIVSSKSTRRLIIRLSSLGDVILATSALEALERRGEPPVDWVVAREYVSLLEGHPMVRRVFAFDRSSGLDGWARLSRELRTQVYDEILDLHDTLRSRMMQRWFRGFEQERPSEKAPRWVRFPKQRASFVGLTAMHGVWPKAWSPEAYVHRFARTAHGSGDERPNLRHLLNEDQALRLLGEFGLVPQQYVCVMPSSKWKGKQWPAQNYAAVFRHLNWLPVVLGAHQDECSHQTVEKLRRAGIEHVSAIGKWDLQETAQILAHSRGILGCDTGLMHLAEAVGVPALVVLGPTSERVGFAPWRSESQVVGAQLWCRPCGKDGRACFRISRRHLCMSLVSPAQVIRQGRQVFGEKPQEKTQERPVSDEIDFQP